MASRKHYREVARALASINEPEAIEGVKAINDLLDDRARLSQRLLRLTRAAPRKQPRKSLLARIFRS